MKKTGVGEIRALRSLRLGGGRPSENRLVSGSQRGIGRQSEPLVAGADCHVEELPDRALARAFGDDGVEPVGPCGGLEHHLAADREADTSDSTRLDVGSPLEEAHGRVDVSIPAPAERVRVALALAFPAPVEEENAVAVLREYPRRLLRAFAAREGDHRRTIL